MLKCIGYLRRWSVFILTAILLSSVMTAEGQNRRKRQQRAPQRTVATVKKDKKSTERAISETSTKLQANTKSLNRQLNRLNSLNADIELSRAKADGLKQHIDSLGSEINVTTDSIKTLENEMEDLRLAYVKALRRLQPHSGVANELSFVFSAETFSEAYSRIRYLRRFSAWRERRVERLRFAVDRIAERQAHLTSLRNNRNVAYREAEETHRTLSKQQDESKRLVDQLRKEDSSLRRSLKEQKRKAAALDRELDRLIAEEQARIAREEAEARRKAEMSKKKSGDGSQLADNSEGKSAGEAGGGNNSKRSAKDVASANAKTRTAAATDAAELTGSFAANKGRLLFPVAGKYKIVRRFGRQPHPTLPHVETDNSGIDIETSAGTSARAIFAGTVSAIFKQDGFNSIVMVRHGRYISIYAGLAGVNVKEGDKVKAGQSLGRIYSDPDDGDRTILHFEIRNERQKLNPSQWVK